ncbi:MAG: hypothetical protein Unbinned4388contig1000_72 [Prokaryotic dsDNA virus sp.]|nr:MAG: hypothetical protein Unbinned4388contig1000_72 [Prokaryotic dsDNA virus sp.]|tara:strand:- start:3184 stop:3483 length:300 start_codon:yes stop_codon:yes gene_type:complete
MKSTTVNTTEKKSTKLTFKGYQIAHKDAKSKIGSIGYCLTWLINNHEDKLVLKAAKLARKEYELFNKSGLPSANKKSGKFNAYQIGWASIKYAALNETK